MLFLPALDITEIQFFELFRKSCENNHTRGVGTGNRGGGQVFRKHKKCPLRWQSALCLRKNVCSDCIFYDCNYLSFRKHKKCPLSGGKHPLPLWKMLFRLHFIWLQLFFLSPPLPVANISVKKISGACPFHSKMPLEPAPPPNLLMLLCPWSTPLPLPSRPSLNIWVVRRFKGTQSPFEQCYVNINNERMNFSSLNCKHIILYKNNIAQSSNGDCACINKWNGQLKLLK